MPDVWDCQPQTRFRHQPKHRQVRTGLKGSHRRARRGFWSWLFGCGK